MQIKVVDVFAGPGGLGEGFSAFSARRTPRQRPFQIAISAEMEVNAARTLRLRAFFRQFAQGHAPASYYEYVAGRRAEPWTARTQAEWLHACEEARQLTLGAPEDDQVLSSRIRQVAKGGDPWVLIGGPPCQAYSLVGRARNQGIKGYRPEEDHRHFLYRHYLTILRKYRPAAFVMENVKGILSSKVGGAKVFPQILEDLSSPGGRSGPRYQVVPLVVPERPGAVRKATDFIVRAESLGVPQARHRVILLGLAEGYCLPDGSALVPRDEEFGVDEVIGGLPELRSGVTDADFTSWGEKASEILGTSASAAHGHEPKVEKLLRELERKALRRKDPGTGGRWLPKTEQSDCVPDHLESWLIDEKLHGILNHEARAHMTADLARYAFAAAFASVHARSPRGADEFPEALRPNHQNWESGKFVDRFKVQHGAFPSSTVTSHLSKDGHYFIHPEPQQLRSLTVREAARLQTFPDNYFFEGARGAQYRQVGNAVPPWLARQIAGVVYSCLRG